MLPVEEILRTNPAREQVVGVRGKEKVKASRKVKVTQTETTTMVAMTGTMTPMIMRTLLILKMTLVGDF